MAVPMGQPLRARVQLARVVLRDSVEAANLVFVGERLVVGIAAEDLGVARDGRCAENASGDDTGAERLTASAVREPA